jgi:hypothetical protein
MDPTHKRFLERSRKGQPSVGGMEQGHDVVAGPEYGAVVLDDVVVEKGREELVGQAGGVGLAGHKG